MPDLPLQNASQRACSAAWIAAVSLALSIAVAGGRASSADDQGGLTTCAPFELVGACYPVHGRLSIYNGNPGLRIWPVGTHRLLGVANSDADERVPGYPACLPVAIGRELYADFIVCPLEPDRPGWMRRVCIESATNLVVEDFNDETSDGPLVYRVLGDCPAR